MEEKIIENGSTSQDKIIKGVTRAVSAIKTTIGPCGKCVAVADSVGVYISRDGASLAKTISFRDPVENIGAQLVKNASVKTEKEAGDGTSTTALLIEEFCKKGKKAVGSGANVSELKNGMTKASGWIAEYIKNKSIPIDGDLEKIKKVATISANNDEQIGELIVTAMKSVGTRGLITADMSNSIETKVDIKAGMKIDRGWSSPQYITENETATCVLENPYILVVSEKISSVNQILKFLEDYQNNNRTGRPLLIVCDDIDDNVNSMFVFNVLQGALRCCIVKGPDFADGRRNIMADLACFTGANYICKESGLTLAKDANIGCLGGASRVVVGRDSTIIYEGYGIEKDIADRAEVIKKCLDSNTVTEYDKTKFAKRLANLTGGVAVIKAGGASETEAKNKKDMIEDAILASHSSIEEGCLPGGGYTYFKASIESSKDKNFWKNLTESEKEGAEIVFSSLPIVLKTISDNSGIDGNVMLDRAKGWKEGFGYNAKTGKICNLSQDGILDSAKVVRVSVENSVSAASMILMTDCVIYDDPTNSDIKTTTI